MIALVAGAIIGAAIYGIYFINLNKTKNYTSEAYFYITANDEAAYNYYNAYTWKSVILSQPIMDTVKEVLQGKYSEEELENSISADVVSDLRIVVVDVTMNSKESADEVMQAVSKGMEGFSEYVDEFDKISLWSLKEAKEVINENMILHAILLGIVLSLIVWFIAYSIYYAVEDSIYVAKDIECLTKLPVLGIQTKKNNAFLSGLLELNTKEICGENAEYIELSVDDEENVVEDLAKLSRQQKESAQKESPENASKVIVTVQFGKHNGRKLTFLLQQAKMQNVKIAGIVIKDADDIFLKQYYHLK